MKRFWNQTIEIKALIISMIATLLGFLGTAFLFWFNRYDIPLAILTSGVVVSLSWFALHLSRKKSKPLVKLDIILIYLRLAVILCLTIIFAIIEINLSLVIISPIFLVISYLVISLLTLLAYFRKGENDV